MWLLWFCEEFDEGTTVTKIVCPLARYDKYDEYGKESFGCN